MGGIYEVRRGDGLRWHDIHTKFHKDWFRHSKVDMGEFTDTQTALGSHKPTLKKKESKIINNSSLVHIRGDTTSMQ
jgi:hypothetical protein